MIVVIDYGMGNVGSILNMLRRVGAPAMLSSDTVDIDRADKLILPGVGAFDTGMRRLADLRLTDLLRDKVLTRRTPLLGICLGMQLLSSESEEGRSPGLGWIQGRTVRFRPATGQEKLRIPHMGWNTVSLRRTDTLFKGLAEQPRFYFVHSYHLDGCREEDILATTTFGGDFVSALQKDNVFATQFHPEKSHKFGMTVLKNFAEWEPPC